MAGAPGENQKYIGNLGGIGDWCPGASNGAGCLGREITPMRKCVMEMGGDLAVFGVNGYRAREDHGYRHAFYHLGTCAATLSGRWRWRRVP